MALRFLDSLFSISYASLVVNGSLEALRSNPWTRSRYIMISRIGVCKQSCEHKFSSAWAPALSLLPTPLCTVLQSVQCLSIAVGLTASRKWSEHPVSLGESERFHFLPFLVFTVWSSIILLLIFTYSFLLFPQLVPAESWRWRSAHPPFVPFLLRTCTTWPFRAERISR